MKRCVRVFGMLLILAVALTSCHNGKRDKEDRKESKRTGKMTVRHSGNQGMGHNRDSYMMRGMRQNQRGMRNMGQRGQMNQRQMGMMHQGAGQPMMGMRPGMANGMRRGMGMGMMSQDSIGARQMGRGTARGMGQMNSSDNLPAGPGGIFLENIPNVTEKQKKEFNDLLKKQQEEMTKMRAEMAAKIRSTIESQRSKMLNIFTSEQKKAIGAR